MEKEDLQKRVEDAVKMTALVNSEGWKLLNEEIDKIYASNLMKLIEKEDEEARGLLRGIQKIKQITTNIISKGKVANKELNNNR